MIHVHSLHGSTHQRCILRLPLGSAEALTEAQSSSGFCYQALSYSCQVRHTKGQCICLIKGTEEPCRQAGSGMHRGARDAAQKGIMEAMKKGQHLSERSCQNKSNVRVEFSTL